MTQSVGYDSPFSLIEVVMARALSDDLWVCVLEAVAAGESTLSMARLFSIRISTAIRGLWRLRESGERAAHRQSRLRGSGLGGHPE